MNEHEIEKTPLWKRRMLVILLFIPAIVFGTAISVYVALTAFCFAWKQGFNDMKHHVKILWNEKQKQKLQPDDDQWNAV